MINKKYSIESENNITDEYLFLNRRKIIKGALASSILINSSSLLSNESKNLPFTKDLDYSTNEKTNSFKQITSYNNFYELGAGKRDPMLNSSKLQTNNWKVRVDGLVENPITLDLNDLTSKYSLEERIYRLRCLKNLRAMIV